MVGREISYGFILEDLLEFLEDPTLSVSDVSPCACLREEFLEWGYGVWPLGLCCHFQVLGAIFTVFVAVYLEKKKVILGEEADV